ncbi:MAG: lipopolysaccharide heptosyltransferase II [Pirellulales bacterium]|nr:lipopolysaccharide heptosyltransferase II [Pirellulales bacterium]
MSTDSDAGALCSPGDRTPESSTHLDAERIGLFLPNWVGDAAMATPALRALRKRYPAARLIGVGRSFLRDLLAGTSWLDELIDFDPRGGDLRSRGLPFGIRLRAARLDAALLFSNSFRTAMWAWASGARRRIGYVRYGRGPLLTTRLHQMREPVDGRWWRRTRWKPSPVLDDYLALAYALDCPVESPRLELATTAADERAAADAWRRLGLDSGRPVLALNSSGAFGAAKLWPLEYFVALARTIVQTLAHDVLVLCGPQERELAHTITAKSASPRVKSLADEPLGLGLTKAALRRCRLLVTTDSGPRHLAAALGIPTVSLFGPTHRAWSENYHPRAVDLQRSVPCGPCQKRVCPLGHHRCMRELTVAEVLGAVQQLLTVSAAAA